MFTGRLIEVKMAEISFDKLLTEVRACTLCDDLPLGPKPIIQGSEQAKILICGQAPGRITHHENIVFILFNIVFI